MRFSASISEVSDVARMAWIWSRISASSIWPMTTLPMSWTEPAVEATAPSESMTREERSAVTSEWFQSAPVARVL